MIFVAETREGGQIRYQDRKRYLWFMSVLMPVVPGVSALAFAQTGAVWWAFVPVLFYFVFIPLLDIAVGEDPNNPPEEVVEQMAGDQFYRRLLFLSIPIYTFSFLAAIHVAMTVDMPLWTMILLAASAGISSGAGLTVAHELGHKPNAADQWGAKIMCALTAYGHFCIEHNRGHHVMVATPEDFASARLGESVYQFQLRELPGVFAHAIRLERARLEKKGLPFLTLKNDILQSWAISALVAAVMVWAYGWMVLPLLLVHHYVGWSQLTYANYVEHYGLKRNRKENGRYEPCQPWHSWNTNHIVSNLMLFHLQRHSDHHANPLRPYQSLRNFEDLPHLPSGYPGSFALAAVPPVWRKVMDRKVHAWAKGDLDACNVQPGLEAHYRPLFQKWS